MVAQKFSLIAAACENLGIGINGKLPWSLKYEPNFVPLCMLPQYSQVVTSLQNTNLFLILQARIEILQHNDIQSSKCDQTECCHNGPKNLFRNSAK